MLILLLIFVKLVILTMSLIVASRINSRLDIVQCLGRDRCHWRFVLRLLLLMR